jgi:hypothetical protein
MKAIKKQAAAKASVKKRCRCCHEMKDIHTDFYPSRVKRYDWMCKKCNVKTRNFHGARQLEIPTQEDS